MKLLIAGAMAVMALAAFSLAQTGVDAQAPGPTAGEQLATGLLSPRGMKVGPDGFIYVAEAGNGGSTTVTVDGADHLIGVSGRISKIDPVTGERTTVADGLPSDFSPATMDSVGPADVAFLGGNLYYLQTHGGDAYGSPDTPTGVYLVNDDGSTELVADIGQFNFDNPVADILPGGGQADIEPGGNPYAMAVRDGAFYVTDGNQNQLMRADLDGTVTRVAEFSGHPVTTGIATQESGPLYVTNLGVFPFAPEDGTVYRVGIPSGSTTEIASGVSSMIDVEFGPGAQLYAMNFADQDTTFASGGPFMPFTATIFRMSTEGDLTPIVTGLTFATAIVFAGDTAYISNNGLSVPGVFEGEIWKIEGVSLLSGIDTPAPEPTSAPVATAPVPTGPITAPDTGFGPDGSGGTPWGVLVLALAGAGIAATAGAGALRRRG